MTVTHTCSEREFIHPRNPQLIRSFNGTACVPESLQAIKMSPGGLERFVSLLCSRKSKRKIICACICVLHALSVQKISFNKVHLLLKKAIKE